MSRSHKKYPVYKKTSAWHKQKASKAVRRTEEVADGKSYKKAYQSWKISEYTDFTPKFKWVESYERLRALQKDGINPSNKRLSDEHIDRRIALWRKFYYMK